MFYLKSYKAVVPTYVASTPRRRATESVCSFCQKNICVKFVSWFSGVNVKLFINSAASVSCGLNAPEKIKDIILEKKESNKQNKYMLTEKC